MKIKVRPLNKNEQYACTSRDIKAIFGDVSVDVYLGLLSRNYKFDTQCKSRPHIPGTIIASMSINQRDLRHLQTSWLYDIVKTHTLQFYVICDDDYTESARQQFVENILPKLYKWNDDTTNKFDGMYGVKELLVEWNCGDFILHEIRYV